MGSHACVYHLKGLCKIHNHSPTPVEYCTQISGVPWSPFASDIEGSGSIVTFRDQGISQHSNRFYRVLERRH